MKFFITVLLLSFIGIAFPQEQGETNGSVPEQTPEIFQDEQKRPLSEIDSIRAVVERIDALVAQAVTVSKRLTGDVAKAMIETFREGTQIFTDHSDPVHHYCEKFLMLLQEGDALSNGLATAKLSSFVDSVIKRHEIEIGKVQLPVDGAAINTNKNLPVQSENVPAESDGESKIIEEISQQAN